MHLRVICVATERRLLSVCDRLRSYANHRLEVVGQSTSIEDLLHRARSLRADVVVMDPQIDDGMLLDRWAEEMGVTPVLICLSSSEHYALQAFQAGAAHYLTFDTLDAELESAIDRAVARVIRYDRGQGNGSRARETRAPFHCRVVALPGSDGIEVRGADQLLSAHGEGGYTRVMFDAEQSVLLSRPLGHVEPRLREAGMIRVHRSHMINPERVRKVRRGKTSVVELVNGLEVDVSERYRDDLFAMLQIRVGRHQDLG